MKIFMHHQRFLGGRAVVTFYTLKGELGRVVYEAYTDITTEPPTVYAEPVWYRPVNLAMQGYFPETMLRHLLRQQRSRCNRLSVPWVVRHRGFHHEGGAAINRWYRITVADDFLLTLPKDCGLPIIISWRQPLWLRLRHRFSLSRWLGRRKRSRRNVVYEYYV